MMRNTLLAILLGCALAANAQVTIGEFILSARRDPGYNTYRDQVLYLQSRPYLLSPLQRLEFRTQNRELLGYQQEFALRLMPANPWEVKFNREYFQSYQSAVALRSQIALKEALLLRYRAAIYYLYYADILKLARESRRLAADQMAIMERQSGSASFDADDYVDLHLDMMERTVELDESELDLVEQRDEIRHLFVAPLPDSIEWGFGSVIDVSQAVAVADSISSAAVASITLAYQKQRMELAANEYRLEKANINVGFLQTEFDHRRVEQNRTPFNISLGVTIPIVNPNKGDMSKRRLEMIEAKYDVQETENTENGQGTAALERLTRLSRRHEELGRRLDGYRSGNLPGILSMLEGGDPRIALRFRDNLVKLEILLLRIRRDALLAYVDYLATTDVLEQQPLVDFLAPDLRKLE